LHWAAVFANADALETVSKAAIAVAKRMNDELSHE
jgi:hypothetical protein